MLNLPLPPPGFRGLDPDKRVQIYTRHLPHWRQEGATYFVTFRLADSLPQAKVIELQNWRAFWEREHPEPRSEKDWKEYAREVFRRTEAWLDEGYGACHFREARWANDLRDRLHHFHGERYQLACWVIMPNHCHLVFRPFEGHELEDLLGAMKGVTAKHLNAAVERTGELWQQECYDRIIRDAEHLHRVIQYIGRNPAQAGVPPSAWFRWIDPEWDNAGWGFSS
ncbi:MAG: transposase [Planctomycetales bacterium]|nr:transposase [Planctomycetales bacterium]